MLSSEGFHNIFDMVDPPQCGFHRLHLDFNKNRMVRILLVATGNRRLKNVHTVKYAHPSSVANSSGCLADRPWICDTEAN
jgi:hypothetical protein